MPASVLTTKSNGGIMTAESAKDAPVETLLSGPASGVVGALYIGKVSGHDRLIAFDMGGTSADIALVGRPPHVLDRELVAAMPIVMPAVGVSSIGAGGGSIAWVDPRRNSEGRPAERRRRPGPGLLRPRRNEPTVTDAYLQVGFRPESFLGGRLALHRAGSRSRRLARVGETLGLDVMTRPPGVLEVATANMYAQLMHRDGAPRHRSRATSRLLAYGGAGPTHALLLAREFGITRVIVPPSPGTLCALDACRRPEARLDQDASTPRPTTSRSQTSRRSSRRSRQDAQTWLADQNAPSDGSVVIRSAPTSAT